MPNRSFLILIALALTPVSLQARLQSNAVQEANPKQGKKLLRMFIDGELSAIPTVTEELRRRADEYGLDLTFVAKLTDAPDGRVILIAGTGKTWDANPNIRPGDIRFPVPFAFTAAAVLTPEGTIVFTVDASGDTPKSANIAVARELIKNLHRHYGTLKKKQDTPNDGAARPQESVAFAEATSSSSGPTEEPPAEPGVYYKAPTGWVRMQEASATGVKAKGMGTTLLTWGISGVRMSQVYPGAKAPLRVSERRPTFYVRRFAVANNDVLIVRLEKKTDHREVATGSISAFNAKAKYRERDILEVRIGRPVGDVAVITPASELEPGEYLLSLATFELGYDFQIVCR